MNRIIPVLLLLLLCLPLDAARSRRKLVKNKAFLKRIWGKVSRIRKDYRTFKTEKPRYGTITRGGKAPDPIPAKQVEEAIPMLRRLLQDKTLSKLKRAEINYLIAHCYMQLKQQDSALRYFDKAAKLAPDNYIGQMSKATMEILKSEKK